MAADPAVVAVLGHLRTAERFAVDDPRAAAQQRAAARLVADAPRLLDAPQLRPWRQRLAQWRLFVPYLLDDATETSLSRHGRATIAAALADLRALDSDPDTSATASDAALHLLDSSDPDVRAQADLAVSAITHRRAPTMCDVLQRLTSLHATDDAARGIDSWRLRLALSQATTTATLDRLLDAVDTRRPLAQQWYRRRSAELGAQFGARYADRRVVPPSATRDLPADARMVADVLAGSVPPLRREIDRAAATVRSGTVNEVAFEPDGRMSVTVDHRPTDRGRLMVAHEMGHAIHALRSRSDEAPGALVGETMACLTALIAGWGFAIDTAGDRAAQTGAADDRAAQIALGDMLVEELFLSALVCRFEDDIQQTVRSGASLTVELLDQRWLLALRRLYGEAVAVPDGVGSHWARLASLAMQPGHAISYVWATVLALAVWQRITVDPHAVEALVDAMDLGAVGADELVTALGLSDDSWIEAGMDALDLVMGELSSCDRSSNRGNSDEMTARATQDEQR